MRVISNRPLVEFAEAYPEAAAPLQAWRRTLETGVFAHFGDLKRAFGSVDKVGEWHVFNIGGNKWRVIAFIHFPAQICYVKHVFTHQHYDRWRP